MPYKDYNKNMAEYMRTRYAKNAEIVRNFKLEKGCLDCGYNSHHAGLEFDHREGRDGGRTVAGMMGKSIKKIFEEIDKCDVVCSTCHSIRTWNRRQNLGV